MSTFFSKHKEDLFWLSLCILLIVFFKLIFINAYIPSESMETTLMTHDRIIGFRLVKHYKRGDIAIFHYDDKDYYIKRVIGVGGDTVSIKNNEVYVNGEKIKEPYLHEPMDTPDAEYVVPENSYFFLGDNRNNSMDSRFWENPFRRKEDMVGKAIFRYWPLNKIGIIKK